MVNPLFNERLDAWPRSTGVPPAGRLCSLENPRKNNLGARGFCIVPDEAEAYAVEEDGSARLRELRRSSSHVTATQLRPRFFARYIA